MTNFCVVTKATAEQTMKENAAETRQNIEDKSLKQYTKLKA